MYVAYVTLNSTRGGRGGEGKYNNGGKLCCVCGTEVPLAHAPVCVCVGAALVTSPLPRLRAATLRDLALNNATHVYTSTPTQSLCSALPSVSRYRICPTHTLLPISHCCQIIIIVAKWQLL